jgi:hypothetical protein
VEDDDTIVRFRAGITLGEPRHQGLETRKR